MMSNRNYLSSLNFMYNILITIFKNTISKRMSIAQCRKYSSGNREITGSVLGSKSQ